MARTARRTMLSIVLALVPQSSIRVPDDSAIAENTSTVPMARNKATPMRERMKRAGFTGHVSRG
jgi:hypothetical protein